MSPSVGGMVGVSTTTVWGGVEMQRCRRVAYLDQHQYRSRYMIFFCFAISKIYIYYVFQPVYVLLKGSLVISDVALTRHYQRRFRPARDVLKNESYYPQTSFIMIYTYHVDLIICFFIYCFRLPHCSTW